MHKNKMLKVNLQMFNDGAASGGEGNGATAQATEGALPKADKSGSSRRNSGAPKVVYGKQTDVSETTTIPAAEGVSEGNGIETTSNTLEERRKAFEELVNGEYKDLFTEKTQGIINRRFKETKALEDALAEQKPLIDMLKQRYQIDGNISALQKAFEEDTGFWEAAAEEAGLTVEQYKEMEQLKKQAAELDKIRNRQIGEQKAQAQLEKWFKEGEEVKKVYPSFDFKAESQNRDFLDLLRKGVSVKQAYDLVHQDEIMEATAKSAAQAAGAQMEARIKSKASRPTENGMSSQSAAIIHKDTVSSLNKKDRAAVAKEVLRGGRVTF